LLRPSRARRGGECGADLGDAIDNSASDYDWLATYFDGLLEPARGGRHITEAGQYLLHHGFGAAVLLDEGAEVVLRIEDVASLFGSVA